MDKNRIIIPILPRAWLQFDSQSAIWWIKEDCRCLHMITKNPDDKGKPCENYSEENPYCFHINEKGKQVNHTLSKQGRAKKRQIERYNNFRTDLFHKCKQLGLQVQAAGMAIYFHYPVPIRWSKTKKKAMHGQMKSSKSDVVNNLKSFEDALTGCDELIGQYSGAGKFWFCPELVSEELRNGYIEVLINQALYNPYNIEFKNPYSSVEMQDVMTRRIKLKERKNELKNQRSKENEQPKKQKIVKPLSPRTQKKLFKKTDNIK